MCEILCRFIVCISRKLISDIIRIYFLLYVYFVYNNYASNERYNLELFFRYFMLVKRRMWSMSSLRLTEQIDCVSFPT